jgi:hypothetical protein
MGPKTTYSCLRNSPGVHPASRLKNLEKFVASSKPRLEAIRQIEVSMCLIRRFASSVMRAEISSLVLLPVASIATRVRLSSSDPE